jgi:hypothetical protein
MGKIFSTRQGLKPKYRLSPSPNLSLSLSLSPSLNPSLSPRLSRRLSSSLSTILIYIYPVKFQVYREPGLTSLAEACERMIESIRHALGHDHVEVLPENQIDLDKLKSSVAYIQMTHVEPFLGDPDNTQASAVEDPMNYMAHTNIRRFFYEEAMMDESVAKDAPEQARLSLRRVYLTGW